MKFRIKHAQQVVGFFLLASFLALAVVLFFMGANQRWFARNYMFFSRFSSAEGIVLGMPVQLRGFEIGKVSGFELNSFNRVKVDIAIYENYYAKIRPDSVLELSVSPIGIGGGTMKLLPGMNMLPPMEENSFLPSSDSTLGKALMAEGLVDKPQDSGAIPGIIAQIEPALVDIRATAQGVTKLLGQFSSAVAGKAGGGEITTIVEQIKTDLENMDKVLSTVATAGANTNTLLVSSRDLIANLNSISGNISNLTAQMQDPKGLVPKLLDPQGSFKTLLDDKNQLYNQINQILSQVNATLGEVKGLATYLNQSTPQITGLVEDATSTIKKTGDVMDGLKNNPLIKGGIPEVKPQTSTPQGQRDENF
jgi:phospholipid/cholesterol/gamma-HCH transport system substrate-binding protein